MIFFSVAWPTLKKLRFQKEEHEPKKLAFLLLNYCSRFSEMSLFGGQYIFAVCDCGLRYCKACKLTKGKLKIWSFQMPHVFAHSGQSSNFATLILGRLFWLKDLNRNRNLQMKDATGNRRGQTLLYLRVSQWTFFSFFG